MTTSTRPAVRRGSLLASAALTAASFALVLGNGAAQAAPDPGVTLTPPPPSGYSCQPTGGGTICHRRMDFSHVAQYDATCPQRFDILENGASTEIGRRTYDGHGFLVRRDLHEMFPASNPLNVFYNSVTGRSVSYRADLTESDTFATPGDFSTMSSTFTGNLYSATLPGSGLLVHDAGLLAFDPAGDVTADHGPKMLFSGDISALCSALD